MHQENGGASNDDGVAMQPFHGFALMDPVKMARFIDTKSVNKYPFEQQAWTYYSQN